MNKTANKYSPEVRERAVRMVLDNQGQHRQPLVRCPAGCHAVMSREGAILSISAKIGCAPQTLNEWVKKVESDTEQRGSATAEQAEKMKALEREVRELKLDLSRFSAAPSARLSHLAFESDGAFPTQC